MASSYYRQRRVVAAKLQQGVKREKILDEIRDNVGEEFGKIHLLDKKEIGTIITFYLRKMKF